MKIKKVELNAFRAYKNKEDGTFDFTLENGTKSANFISIYAPNGFGKTSFYDGVEWAMTNRVSRLDKLSKNAEAERKNATQLNDGRREKQYILKNKFSSDDTIGYVQIWTDKEESPNKREVNTIRAGGNDYYTSSVSVENDYFRSVILAQDGIDDFLKADDDRERYDKFINFFGDEKLAKYHENITKLEKKNKEELLKLKESITTIEDILKEPIDEQIFQFTNDKINELNKLGKNFEIIGSDFDEVKKLQFEGTLSEQKTELLSKIDSVKKELEGLPKWLASSESYFNNKGEFDLTQSKLKDYDDLDKSHKTIKFLKQEILQNQQLRNEYDQLSKHYPIYKTIMDEITTKEKELTTKTTEKNENEKSNAQIASTYSETLKQIELTEFQKKQLIDLLQLAPEIYNTIVELTDKIQRNKNDLDAQKKAFKEYQDKIELLKNDQGKSKLIIESIGKNVFRDIDLSNDYNDIVKQIEKLRQENESKQKKLHDKINQQTQNQQYDAQIKELLSLGVGVIEKNQTNTCPLCNEKQSSYQILKDKILNNQLLDNIDKELFEQIEQIKLDIKNNEDTINLLKNSIIEKYNKQIQAIETELTILDIKIKSINLDSLQENVNAQESSLALLLKETENKSKDDFITSKTKSIDELSAKLTKNYEQKRELEKLLNDLKIKIELNNLSIDNISKNINELKAKEEYKNITLFAQKFDNNIDIKLKLDELTELNNNLITKNFATLESENKFSDALIVKYSITNIDDIQNSIKELKDFFSNMESERLTFESSYKNYFKHSITDLEQTKYNLEIKRTEIEKILMNSNKCMNLVNTLAENLSKLLKFIESKNKEKELAEYKIEFEKKEKVSNKIRAEKGYLEKKIEKDVEAFFHEELINQIYSKIDPHPDYKNVSFKCSFENGVGKLNVFVTDENNNKPLSPSLYYSTAQLNVLSLSIFLAKALHAKDDKGNSVDCIFIDDPIQAMDSINILSTIDLLRSLVANYDKQIILSTHDENFHRLLEKKIPPEYFDSKFIELETFGKVKHS